MGASEPVRPTERPRESRRFAVRLSDLPLDVFRIVVIDEVEIGVVRTPRGVYALRNLCPHMGAPVCRGDVRGFMRGSSPEDLEYDDDVRVIRCPWHGWEYSLETGRVEGRALNRRVKTYRVEVEGDEVYVYV